MQLFISLMGSLKPFKNESSPNLSPLILLLISLSLGVAACTKGNKNTDLKIDTSKTFFRNLTKEPENLHPIRSTDSYARVIQNHILESLLERNYHTYEWESLLAKKWEVSPDGLLFTFELHDNLKWSDGKPLTAKDIKFSFEAYRNPEYGGLRHLPYYERMESAKVIDDKKIQFKVREPYFGNLNVIAGMKVLPEHIYKDPKSKLSKTILGSGPYAIHQYIKGKILVLKQNPLWAGANQLTNKGKWKFPFIAFRFVPTEVDTILRMEKEQLDFSSLSAESFLQKTNDPPWSTKIKKVKFSNSSPSGYDYIGLNLKRPLFKDRRVRRALAHLMNRKLMNKKFNYDQKELARGPWYFWSEYADPRVEAIPFDPSKAIQLLKSAGWEDRDKNGILDKEINGQKKEFSFSILFSSKESEKLLTLYQEDLKNSGIKISLRFLDWTSFLRLINDKNFDALMIGWSGGSIDLDPKQIWHSKSAEGKGSNFISYSNPQVDTLINQGRSEFDKKKRIEIFKKIYRLVADDIPYIFMFNSRINFYGLNKRVSSPADAFKYDVGISHWSLQSDP